MLMSFAKPIPWRVARWALSAALLSNLGPVDAARQEVHVGLLTMEEHASQRSSVSGTRSVETLPFLDMLARKDPLAEYLVRKCVGEYAKDWIGLNVRVGPLSSNYTGLSAQEMVDTVQEFYRLEDLLAARRQDRGLSDGWRRFFSSNVTAWTGEQAKTREKLKAVGFDIDTSLKYCQQGWTEEAHRCMIEKACPSNSQRGYCTVTQGWVRQRLDAKDSIVHLQAWRSWHSKKTLLEKQLAEKIAILTEQLESQRYQWKKMKKSCIADFELQRARIKDRIEAELSATEKVGDNCEETPGSMCPEGTFATTQRRWKMGAGVGAASTTYLIGKFTIYPGSIAAATALFGASLGAVVGFIAAGPISGLVAFAVGYWAARGPMECACFPRKCKYNDTADACQLEGHDKVSSNPFSTTLPMVGMKCVLSYNERRKCSLQQCASGDYGYALPSTEAFFGTLGPKEQGLYNCLSASPSELGTLAYAETLPEGESNTVAGRSSVYLRLLGTAEA